MNMRAATPDDLERALELLRLDEENLTGRPSCIGPSDLRQWLGDATLGEDTWLREDDGKLAAFYGERRHGGRARANLLRKGPGMSAGSVPR
jgi:hypothetical protein